MKWELSKGVGLGRGNPELTVHFRRLKVVFQPYFFITSTHAKKLVKESGCHALVLQGEDFVTLNSK